MRPATDALRLNPLLVHELRRLWRARRRLAGDGLGQAFVLVLFAIAYGGALAATAAYFKELEPHSDGHYFAMSVAHGVLWIVLALVPLLAAGAISGERQAGSLDLLLTTPLRNQTLLAGKWLSNLLVPLAVVCLALPILAVLARTPAPIIGTLLLVLTGLVPLLISIGLLCSVLLRHPVTARLAAAATAWVVLVIVPTMHGYGTGPWARPVEWLLPTFALQRIGAHAPNLFVWRIATVELVVAVALYLLALALFDRAVRFRSARPTPGDVDA